MSKIEIIPFVGAGPYIFGKSFEDLKITFCNKEIQIIEDNKGKRIINGSVNMKFYKNKLSEFSIIENHDFFYHGIDIFSDAFVEFLKEKYNYKYRFGFLIFDTIGIALSGLVDKEEQRTITIYQEGAWNEILSLKKT